MPALFSAGLSSARMSCPPDSPLKCREAGTFISRLLPGVGCSFPLSVLGPPHFRAARARRLTRLLQHQRRPLVRKYTETCRTIVVQCCQHEMRLSSPVWLRAMENVQSLQASCCQGEEGEPESAVICLASPFGYIKSYFTPWGR